MQTTTKGIIIREQTIGESDRLVTLLTADFGLVKAFVRRAKTIKSKNLSATSLFVYGEFSLYRGKDAFIIDNATPVEVFFELRADIERLALAQYFAQITYYMAGEEQPAPEMLRLLLNSLHLLCRGKKDLSLIKTVFELRLTTLAGYMPNLVACYRCGAYETDTMSFDMQEGCIYCSDCHRNNAVVVPLSVISAMRFICLAELNKIFSFSLAEDNMALLCSISEQYLLTKIEGRVTTLEFYKGLFS